VRSRASSFNGEYPLLSLRSSSNFLHLLPHLPDTSISPFIFPSITRCRRQFLRKVWPIQLAFCLLISCRIFLCSLTLSNTSSFLTWSVQLIFSILHAPHLKTFQVFLIYCPKRPSLTWFYIYYLFKIVMSRYLSDTYSCFNYLKQIIYVSYFIQYQILYLFTTIKTLGSQFLNSTFDLFCWRRDDDLLTGRNM